MKRTLAYLLLLIFLIQSFEVILINANFKLNQNYFEEICINKDKAEMKCNGKCHLKRQISQSEQNRSEKEEVKTEKETQIFITQVSFVLPGIPPRIAATPLQPATILHPADPVFVIFHPPKAC